MFEVLGLDVITTASVYGYEGSNEENQVGEKEKVILPDTSHFLHSSLKVLIAFQKYIFFEYFYFSFFVL